MSDFTIAEQLSLELSLLDDAGGFSEDDVEKLLQQYESKIKGKMDDPEDKNNFWLVFIDDSCFQLLFDDEGEVDGWQDGRCIDEKTVLH